MSDISVDLAVTIIETCEKYQIVSVDGAVVLDIEKETLSDIMESAGADWQPGDRQAYIEKKERVLAAILKSRYRNLYGLLRQHVSERTYMGIVRNEILVDVQGDDILYQIFTSNILQRNPGDEAPFLEFIQRVCSECKGADGSPVKIKPGCGGFG